MKHIKYIKYGISYQEEEITFAGPLNMFKFKSVIDKNNKVNGSNKICLCGASNDYNLMRDRRVDDLELIFYIENVSSLFQDFIGYEYTTDNQLLIYELFSKTVCPKGSLETIWGVGVAKMFTSIKRPNFSEISPHLIIGLQNEDEPIYFRELII